MLFKICNFLPRTKKHIGLLEDGSTKLSILVSMCGKTVDIPWLCSRGHSVTATELSPIAVEGLFKENSIPHVINGTHKIIITNQLRYCTAWRQKAFREVVPIPEVFFIRGLTSMYINRFYFHCIY